MRIGRLLVVVLLTYTIGCVPSEQVAELETQVAELESTIAELQFKADSCASQGRVEGNSYYLGSGPVLPFPSMRACEREGTKAYLSGGPVYSNFICRDLLTGESRRYSDGKRADT